MTHDDLTKTLRDCDAHASFSTTREAADRLDQYRDLLLRVRIVAHPNLLRHINEVLGGGGEMKARNLVESLDEAIEARQV